jgi:hypothetical protein
MLDVILKILTYLKDGAVFYKQKNKDLYNNFLEPAMNDFEKVHNNYLETFKTYLELIQNDKYELKPSHPVFEMIIRDSLFSENLRHKIYSFCDYADDRLGEFSKTILDYFQNSSSVTVRREIPIGNILRGDLFAFLKEQFRSDDEIEMQKKIRDYLDDHYPRDPTIPPILGSLDIRGENRKEAAVEIIIKMISELQCRYKYIIHEYALLKSDLLD